MLVHTNKKELEQLAKYFYHISKTLISIYDSDMNIIAAYPSTLCDFCTQIRTSNTLHNECIANDNTALETCRKTRQTHIYRCHMGLVEVTTPIIYNNIVVGYLLFGQITDQKDKRDVYEKIESLPDYYGFDKNELMQAASKIRYRSHDYIESISALVEMCANYIWLNNIISVRDDGLAHNINLYIRENLSGDLSIPVICNTFHIGRSKLYELAQTHFGCSICEYVQLCRLNKAKELLSKLDLSVSEVSESVGFKDVNYFIRFFKKHTGITPKKFQTGHFTVS